jgi:hypothetical protein
VIISFSATMVSSVIGLTTALTLTRPMICSESVTSTCSPL